MKDVEIVKLLIDVFRLANLSTTTIPILSEKNTKHVKDRVHYCINLLEF